MDEAMDKPRKVGPAQHVSQAIADEICRRFPWPKRWKHGARRKAQGAGSVAQGRTPTQKSDRRGAVNGSVVPTGRPSRHAALPT
jgi:hypothetical protein